MPSVARRVHGLIAASLVLVIGCHRPSAAPANADAIPPGVASTLINHVVVFDGTGSPARPGSVRIAGDRIIAVGSLQPRSGETIIDGGGLALAPGFIDTHSHADRGLRTGSNAFGALSQGITTVVVGQDGSSRFSARLLLRAFARAARR